MLSQKLKLLEHSSCKTLSYSWHVSANCVSIKNHQTVHTRPKGCAFPLRSWHVGKFAKSMNPKNPDPSKMAILRTQTPVIQVQTLPLEGPRILREDPFSWRCCFLSMFQGFHFPQHLSWVPLTCTILTSAWQDKWEGSGCPRSVIRKSCPVGGFNPFERY